jgi:hypothetical protein
VKTERTIFAVKFVEAKDDELSEWTPHVDIIVPDAFKAIFYGIKPLQADRYRIACELRRLADLIVEQGGSASIGYTSGDVW